MSRGASTPIIDFGAHFYAPTLEARQTEHATIERYAGAAICTDIDALRERYAEAAIDGVVLSQPYHIGSAAVEEVRHANDRLGDVIEAYDDVYGLAALPTAAGGEAAADEFERSLEVGYHGGAIETRSDGIELDDDSLAPVFEVADRSGAPLLVHPTLNDSLGTGVLDDHWQQNVIFGRELSLAKNIAMVIHDGVYDRYPDLTLVFHHGGGNIAGMLGRIEGSLERAHRNGEDHLKTADEFTEQLASRVYVDTSGFYGDVTQFRTTLETLPATNVMFATDFPYETVQVEAFEEIVSSLSAVRSGTELEAILGGNALELLTNAR